MREQHVLFEHTIYVIIILQKLNMASQIVLNELRMFGFQVCVTH